MRAGAGRHGGGRTRVSPARCRLGWHPAPPPLGSHCRCCAPPGARHPGVVLYFNETYGTALSELVMNGRMDLAVLYGGRTTVHGLAFQPLLRERLYLVGSSTPCAAAGDRAAATDRGNGSLPAAPLQHRPQDGGRRLRRHRASCPGSWPKSNSPSTLTSVIAEGMGATILPESMAREVVASSSAWLSRIVEPAIEAPLALCQSDHLPLSEPAQARSRTFSWNCSAELPGNLLVG